MHPFEFTRNNFSWIFSHAEAIPLPFFVCHFEWIMIGLVGHSNSKDVWIWMDNKSLRPPFILCAPSSTREKGFLCKVSMHKDAHAPLFSHIEWIRMSWLAFEFKFDLNSNEQPLIFIPSRGENAEKMHFTLFLKGREDRACANLILERRVAWESFLAWEKKRKGEKRKKQSGRKFLQCVP